MFSLPRIVPAFVLSALALPALCGPTLSTVAGVDNSRTALTVGIDYAPAPFVGGDKVRTPERVATLLAEELARSLGGHARFVEQDVATRAVPAGTVDVAVLELRGTPPLEFLDAATYVPTGQVTHPMAIMRIDSDIKHWSQLKGRTVCVSEDGRYVSQISERYGAIEQVHPSPADALLALRIGQCDVAVHDDVLLKALLKFPEWKKFSSTLISDEATEQYFVVTAGNDEMTALLNKTVAVWQRQGHLKKLVASMARDIAFEVYLDQTVPDCH